jgi:dipeptide/tripeptide permease
MSLFMRVLLGVLVVVGIGFILPPLSSYLVRVYQGFNLYNMGFAPTLINIGINGLIAAFIHSSVVLNVGSLHGGLNLYNNGFAAGIVAAILVPMIQAFRKDED